MSTGYPLLLAGLAHVFHTAKKEHFKQFVILDSDGVVSALSAIDGGQIDEILTRSAEESDGGIGGEVGAGTCQGKGSGRKHETLPNSRVF